MSKAETTVAILDYGMGNLRSVARAVEAVGGVARLVDSPTEVRDVAGLIFPGQGAIVDTVRELEAKGWDCLIRDWIAADRPFLGICLGLQALFDFSEEGDTPGLGIFPGRVSRFRFPAGSGLKVPHMGWNDVQFVKECPLGDGLGRMDESFYFVHSYRVASDDDAIVWGRTTYGDDCFVSAIASGNCFATQFHPEKSQAKGLQIYRNFLNHAALATP